MAWRSCQQRWHLDYEEGHRAPVFGVHLDFGTSVHGAIEKYKTRKDPITLEAAVKLFEEKFVKLYDANSAKYEERDRKQPAEVFLEAGKRILESLDKCEELASAEVVYNEFKLQLPIERTDDVKIEFKGYIDLVIKTKDKRGNTILYICDFKTCSWGWPREKRQDRDLQAQLFFYKHFLCKKFDLDPGNVRCAFVLLKKRPAKGAEVVEFFPVSAGPVSVQRALNVLNSDITEMAERSKDGKYKKNWNACVNDFGQRCPYSGTMLCRKE